MGVGKTDVELCVDDPDIEIFKGVVQGFNGTTQEKERIPSISVTTFICSFPTLKKCLKCVEKLYRNRILYDDEIGCGFGG